MIEISPKDIGIRNKIKIYKATDTYGYFWIIISISQKTKLLTKDVKKFEEIYSKLCNYSNHKFKNKVLFLNAPICLKAKNKFKELSWKII